MLRVIEILGNLNHSSELAERHRAWQEDGAVERLALDMWSAQRSRLRATTDAYTELGIALPRGQALTDGDVLLADEAKRRMIVVAVEQQRVMVCEIDAAANAPARIALELGHALGNQHWPIAANGLRVYVPAVADEAIMDAMMRARKLPNVTWYFTAATADMSLPVTAPSHEHTHGHADRAHEPAVAHHHHDVGQ